MQETMIQSEKMLSLGGLAAGMAHEINNPLAGILQNLQVIKNRTTKDIKPNQKAAESLDVSFEDVKAYLGKRDIFPRLDAIEDSAVRAAHIVENILSFSRKSKEGMVMADVVDLLNRTLQLASNEYDLKKAYDFRNISIVREFASDLPQIRCEPTKLQQVLLNLLRNAAEAMAHAEITEPTIIVRIYPAKQDGESIVVIDIEDNGPGIAPDARPRIFEPFFTTKPVGVGTGLGLSISYFIITHEHQGTIDILDAPQTGACFHICLPVEHHLPD